MKIILFFLILVPFFLKAQSEKKEFADYLENIDKYSPFIKLYFDSIPENAEWMMKETTRYLELKKTDNRYRYYDLIYALGFFSDREELKHNALILILNGCSDNDRLSRNICYSKLSFFEKRIFSDGDKEKIRLLLHQSLDEYFQILLLCGYLDLKIEKKFIKNKFLKEHPSDQFLYKSNYWAARLALARMGDKRSLHFVIERYNAEKDLNKKCFHLSQNCHFG